MTHRDNDEEFKRLLEGYKQFQVEYFKNPHNTLYEDLTENGQSPKTMVIACSDSRVDPSIILNSAPGDLFVVRNVANLVPPFERNPGYHGTSAALEFAVQTLCVQHVVILGHSYCGGIRELIEHPEHLTDVKENSFLRSWMQIAEKARAVAIKETEGLPFLDVAKACERESLRASYNNLLSFPWLKDKVERGALTIHAWHFDLNTGVIYQLNEETDKFEPLEGKNQERAGSQKLA